MTMGTNAFLQALAFWIEKNEVSLAYLDPGTGSILLQAVIGGIAAGLVGVRMYWKRITRFFRPGATDESTTRSARPGK